MYTHVYTVFGERREFQAINLKPFIPSSLYIHTNSAVSMHTSEESICTVYTHAYVSVINLQDNILVNMCYFVYGMGV